MIKYRQYGTVIMARGICEACGESCLIVKGNLSSCCHEKVEDFKAGGFTKECNVMRRKYLKKEVKDKILKTQEYKCYWCNREFGNYVISNKGIIKEITPVFDHYIPFAYTSSNGEDQFVASCRFCNSWKAAKIIIDIKDEDALKKYMNEKWKKSIWNDI